MGACSSSSSSESPEGEAEAPKKKEIVLKSRSATPSASELMARMKMSSCPNIDLASKMVAKGDLNFVRTFVEAWPTTAYEYAPILVDIAANERKYKIWQLFIDESICEVSWKRPSGYSPLMEAIFAADVEMVDFLMKAGADVNELYLNNWTTLMLAVKERQPDIVEALVKHKRDGDPVNNIDDRSYPDGWTALLLAANLDEKEEIKCKMIDILLDAGANPNLIYCGAIDEEAETDEEDREGESEGKNSKDEKGGLTALHIAAMKGEASICKALVRAGADVTMVGKDDNTSLHYACINGNVEVAKILIGACKSETLEEFINMRSNRDGWTGLHFCAKLGHSQIGLELMNCNADTNIKSIENGMSPYALAKASNSSLLLHIITPAMDDIMRDSSIVISPSTQLSSKAPPRNSVKSVSEAPRETRSETSTAPQPEVTEATVEVETLGDRHSVPSSIRPSGEAPPRNPLKSVSEAPIEGRSKISAAPQSEVTEAEAPSLGASPVGFENSTFENTSNLGHDPIPSEQISEDDEEAHILPETTGTGASPPSQPSPMDKVGPKLKKGFMMKQGDWLKDERKRWFVLERGRLCYYLKASTYPPYGEEKKGEMIIDESVGIYTLERPPTFQGDRDSRSSDRGSSFMTMRETFTSSTMRNSVNRRVCKTDKQILIIRKIGGQDDADLFVCQSREERNEWVLALESHKYSNSV